MSKPIYPWIIGHDGRGDKPFGFECERCGTFQQIRTPMGVEKFISVCKTFTQQHIGCKEAKP
jgi:hypothetical protein